MRDYGKLSCEFWTSPTIRELSDDGKMLAAYLLTNQHGNLIGCYRLPEGYVCDDLGWTSQRVAKGFAELSAKGFVTVCEQSKYVRIVKYLIWNPLENPNQVKAGVKLFHKLPDSLSGKGDLAKVLKVEYSEPLPNPSETLSKPVAVAVAVTVTGTGTENILSGKFRADRVEQTATAKRVIDFLNLKAGKDFQHVPANVDFIVARLKEGATEQDCKSVIARKCRDWLDDAKMRDFLRPKTLFNASNFASYRGELVEKPEPWAGAI